MHSLASPREVPAVSGALTDELQVCIPQEWQRLLTEQIGALRDLTENTEDDFLSLGERFNQFYLQANEIVQDVRSMVSQVSGERATATSAELHSLLEKMENFLAVTDLETTRVSDSFIHILDLFASAEEQLANFKKINKILRMLSTSTKIESARMGASAAGFDTLANDVAAMSVQVLEKAGSVLAMKQELTGTLQAALRQVSGAGAIQSERVRETLQKTRQDILLIENVNSRCRAAGDLIDQMGREVTEGLSQVVMSMQSHDITRQQIEHVYQALSDLTAHYEQSDSKDRARETIQETGDICELQSAQLQHAAVNFRDAVDTIITNLQHVAQRAAGMAGEIGGMMGVADQAGTSFLTGMEQALVFANTTLEGSSRVHQELLQVMKGVSDKVGEIVLFVKEIAHIGDEIELIALNAQIKSACAGVEGDALGVLAEAIQRLSVETSELTVTTSSILFQIRDSTEQLCAGVDDDTTHLLHDVHEMSGEVDGLMGELRQLNAVLTETSSAMHEVVAVLGDNISQAVGAISVHETISRVAEQVAGTLQGIVSAARSLVPSAVGGIGDDRIKRLAERYTMHSERLVHEKIAQGSVSSPLPSVPTKPATGDDGLGDNVELF